MEEITLRADVPLPIAHGVLIGVPSGVIMFQSPKPSPEQALEDLSLRRPHEGHPELADAKALYAEAVCSTNPFHQFLALWRVYENVKGARKEWGKQERRPDKKVREERMPDRWAWRSLAGWKFGKVEAELRDPFRHALAHADPSRKVLSAATARQVDSVACMVPVIRYMARTILENFEATLDQGMVREPGEDSNGA